MFHLEDAFRRRLPQRAAQGLERVVGQTVVHEPRSGGPSGPARLQRAQSLLERFLERAADRHRLTDGLHLRGEIRARARKLLECEAWYLDDDVVVVVAHHLQLELLPPDDASLDQNLVRRREIETVAHDPLELLAVVGDSATRSAERERRTNDRRKTRAIEDRFGLVEAFRDAA